MSTRWTCLALPLLPEMQEFSLGLVLYLLATPDVLNTPGS